MITHNLQKERNTPEESQPTLKSNIMFKKLYKKIMLKKSNLLQEYKQRKSLYGINAI